MASSGSFSGSIVSGHYTLRVDWSQERNIAANTSTITCSVYLVNDWSLTVSGRTDNTIVIDGVTYTFATPAIHTTGTHLLISGAVDVAHDSDGKKTLTIKAAYHIRATINGTYYGTITAQATVNLDSIPRASTVSAPTATIGQSTTITISAADPSFLHTLVVSIGTLTGTIISQTSRTTIYWDPPAVIALQIPNATQGIATMTCSTYDSGGTLLGSSSTTFTVNVPESMIPTISSLSAARIDGEVPEEWGEYVKTKSRALLEIIGAAGSNGSTIKYYSITGNGYVGNEASLTTGLLNTAGDHTFTATVTDSRGRVSAPVTVSIDVLDYAPAVLLMFYTERCDSTGHHTDDGTYICGHVEFNYSSCNGKNTIQTTVLYKKASDTEWTDAGVTFTSGVDFVFGGGQILTEYTYNVRFEIADAFTTITFQSSVTSAEVTMDFKEGGTGVAVGKVAELDDVFEVAAGWTIMTKGKTLFRYIIDAVYPVGSIYLTLNTTSPAVLFGGTWVQYGQGRVLVGEGTGTDVNGTQRTFENGSSGGEYTHRVTIAEAPTHNHTGKTSGATTGGDLMRVYHQAGALKAYATLTGYGGGPYTDAYNDNFPGEAHYHTIPNQGGNEYHNNIEPYVTCYMWRRTA